MASSQSRPLLGGDEEPEWIFYNGDSIDNNFRGYGIKILKIEQKLIEEK